MIQVDVQLTLDPPDGLDELTPGVRNALRRALRDHLAGGSFSLDPDDSHRTSVVIDGAEVGDITDFR